MIDKTANLRTIIDVDQLLMLTSQSLWEILVPTMRRVDGKPYRLRYHRVWDAKVRAISGGLTIMKASVGQWVSPDNELFVERMIPVRFVATDDQMDEIVDMTIRYYDQLAVMVYKISDTVIVRYAQS
jgi:hypothetical protein